MLGRLLAPATEPVYAFVFLYIACKGAGLASIDGKLKKD